MTKLKVYSTSRPSLEFLGEKEVMPSKFHHLYSHSVLHLTSNSNNVYYFEGFGSMLRAIGAQIEKTTNRDACRDLSGRRLRDINEEQRLKKWFDKQAEREEEKKEAKKRKLEKLRQVAAGPKATLTDDKEYNQQRADMADSVYEAVDKGFQVVQSASEVEESQDKSGPSCSIVNIPKEKTSVVVKPKKKIKKLM